MRIWLVILIGIQNFQNLAFAAANQGNTLDRLECPYNEKICTEMTCQLVPVSRFVANITIACRGLKKPLGKIKIHVVNYSKAGRQKYKKGIFDVTLDFCQLCDGGNDQFLKVFWPMGQKLLRTQLHSCPYTDQMGVTNVTIDGTGIPTFNRKSAGSKTEITFMDQYSLQIFTLNFFGTVVNE